jgi:protein SCO1/2
MKIKTNKIKFTALKSLRAVCIFLAFALAVGSLTAGADDDSVHAYPAHGVVKRIAPDHRQVTIHHQLIPGYMMEMTMDFNVENTNELNAIVPGDKVDFTLVVNETNSWVENIRRTGHTDAAAMKQPQKSSEENEGFFVHYQPGDPFPGGKLITEQGKRINLSDFHGNAVALTFFFTRCPLPNYCPLMNRNFAAARDLLLAKTHAPTNWELLSISFDTSYDLPETLSQFAPVYRGENTNHWLFTTATTNALATWAPHIGLMVMRQGANFSHNLRTIVLDSQGRLFRQFNGNTWTAEELADAICAAARETPPESEKPHE